MSVLLGLALLAAGLFEMLPYLLFRGRICGIGGATINGAITLLLGLLVLFNRWITVAAAPVLFSAWILLTGAGTARRWPIFLALGLIQVAAGLAALFQPMAAVRVVGLLAGLQLALRGADALLSALFLDSFYL